MFRYGEDNLNDWRHRSPLVCLFEQKESQQKFYLVTVHLARGNAKLRKSQATGLRKWASKVGLPVFAVGDFNFDYNFKTNRGNPAFAAFLVGDVFRWARPNNLVDTNWSDSDGDGVDNYPGNCLDFAFYAGLRDGWKVTTKYSCGMEIFLRRYHQRSSPSSRPHCIRWQQFAIRTCDRPSVANATTHK